MTLASKSVGSYGADTPRADSAGIGGFGTTVSRLTKLILIEVLDDENYLRMG
jgi:hypothetical protein